MVVDEHSNFKPALFDKATASIKPRGSEKGKGGKGGGKGGKGGKGGNTGASDCLKLVSARHPNSGLQLRASL